MEYIEDWEVFALRETDQNVMPITVDEFLQAQAEDNFCQSKANSVGEPGSQFDYDQYGFLVRKSTLDGSLQRVVPRSLRARVLYLGHYPALSGGREFESRYGLSDPSP